MKTTNKNTATPAVGQYVYDRYYNTRRKVMSIVGDLFFVGSEHEPVRRHEFVFPLPKN